MLPADQLDGSGRSWRADIAFLSARLLVEVDGGVHMLRKRFDADIPKSQAALALGYRVLRVSPKQVASGEALEHVRRALG